MNKRFLCFQNNNKCVMIFHQVILILPIFLLIIGENMLRISLISNQNTYYYLEIRTVILHYEKKSRAICIILVVLIVPPNKLLSVQVQNNYCHSSYEF